MRTYFGQYGSHVEVFDTYEAWAAARVPMLEAGLSPVTGRPFEDPVTGRQITLQEALVHPLLRESPETKADLAAFLWEPIRANFYQGWEVIESIWSTYTGRVPLRTFDEYRTKRFGGLTGIGPLGELGTPSGLRRLYGPEYGLTMDTYGAVYALTRHLLLTYGVAELLQNLPRDIGEAMADYVTRLVVSFIVANPNAPDGVAMAHASRGNVSTDAVNEDSVLNAAVWLGTRRDPLDGRPIRGGVRAAVVQNDRVKYRILQVLNSSELVGSTGTTRLADDRFGRGQANVLSNIMPADAVRIDPWFPDARNVHYFGNTDRYAAFVVTNLQGNDRPMIGMKTETVQHLANSNGSGMDPYSFLGDSIDYKTRHDVGVQAVEPQTYYLQAPA